jgi:4-amino-4-deoxy-L-arabinose transferase-like glycosyltransferase
VLFDLGRRLSGPWTGFWAAAFYSLCPFAVAQSHLAKPHPYSAFWALAAVRCLFLAFEGGLRREYLLAGLCLGMAAGANSSFACLAFLPLLVWLLRRRRGLGDALLSMAVAGGIYALTNPYVFIATRDFLWETTVYPGAVRHLGGNLASLLGPWSWAGLGPGLYVVSAAGFLSALFRPDPRRRMLALTCACGFGLLWLLLAKFWGFLDAAGLRFFMPFYALAGLLAADAVCSIKSPRWLRYAVLAAVFADCGLRSWAHLQNFHLDAGPRSTREQAADWIEANMPAGTTVGLPRYPQPAHTPPFRYDRYHLVIFEKPELLQTGRRPEFLVTDAANRASLEPLVRGGYELARAFPSFRAAWAGVGEENFANAGFLIYRRRDAL